jgi:hypothetical protein
LVLGIEVVKILKKKNLCKIHTQNKRLSLDLIFNILFLPRPI